MNKTLRLLPAITVLLIFGGIGIDLSRAGEEIRVAVWTPIQPKLVEALTGDVFDIKVGPGYRFTELDFVGETALGFQWIMNPKTAGARRILTVYNLNSLRDRWDDIRAEFRQDPTQVALMTKDEDTYYGTPVKWNKGFAGAMQSVWEVQFDWGAGEIDALSQATAEEIVTLAAFNQVSPILATSSPRALKVLGVDQNLMETGWPDKYTMDLIYSGNVEAAENLRPSVTFYIAFAREPEALGDVLSVAEVISMSGWQGEILGETVTGWPVDRND